MTEPRQAAERAWHLADGAAGPDEDVAAALDLVAADARRRGALADSPRRCSGQRRFHDGQRGSGSRRRRAAAVAHLDAFDFDAALALVDPAMATRSPPSSPSRRSSGATERRPRSASCRQLLPSAAVPLGRPRRPPARQRPPRRCRSGAGRRRRVRRSPGGACPRRVRHRCPRPVVAAAARARRDDAALGRRARRRWLLAAAATGRRRRRPASRWTSSWPQRRAVGRSDPRAARELRRARPGDRAGRRAVQLAASVGCAGRAVRRPWLSPPRRSPRSSPR